MRIFLLDKTGFHPASSNSIETLKALMQTEDRPHLWVDMQGPTPEHVAVMRDVFHFHPLAVEDTINSWQRPKIEEYGDILFTIINPATFTARDIEFTEIDVFISNDFLVTVHEKEEPVIESVLHSCMSPHSIRHNAAMSVAYAIYLLVDHVIDGYLPMVESLEDEADAISEATVIKAKSEQLQRLRAIKRDLNDLSRVLMHQRDMFTIIQRENQDMIGGESLRYYLRDVQDHALRLVDSINSLRESLNSATDLYFSSQSNRLNFVVQRLTFITIGIGILTVLSGFYGMNFLYTWPPFESPWGVPFVLMCMVIGFSIILIVARRNEE